MNVLFVSFFKYSQALVEEWDRKLKLFASTLDEWLLCQRNWLYLETIFSAADIQRWENCLLDRFSIFAKAEECISTYRNFQPQCDQRGEGEGHFWKKNRLMFWFERQKHFWSKTNLLSHSPNAFLFWQATAKWSPPVCPSRQIMERHHEKNYW